MRIMFSLSRKTRRKVIYPLLEYLFDCDRL